jgi:eukaryotic-like serine/threonine-protein kinase
VDAPDAAAVDLARAILDGTSIDWGSVHSGTAPVDPALVEQLKLLARVADVHRRPTPREPEAGERWGHLRVLRRLGAGAHGVVYRAWDTRLEREVALKLLPAGGGDAFDDATSIEEGRLLARVRHPNVVTIFGAEQIGDHVGLWMELVEGETLEELLERGRAFTPSEARRIGIELCHALTAVHRAGLLHRDIKMHNVMLANDGRVVLMDFGTGREREDASMAPVAGTPLYLAPEIFAGGSASVRSDIYGTGVLLYRLLTGRYPVAGDTLHDLRLAHERGRRKALEPTRLNVPRRLRRIVERAIDPHPDHRYESAEAMASALAGFRAGHPHWGWYIVPAITAAVLLAAWLVPGVRAHVGPRSKDERVLPRTAAGGIAGTSVASVPIVAVLPLQNLSAEPDSDYFADGLTDEIIRNLAAIEGLTVRSRTSSFYYKNKPRNLHDVGSQLGATFVVEGSVLRSGRRLRVNVQLVQVAGDVPLWSERFDRDLADVFAVQDEISRAIVNKLRVSVGRGRRRYDTNVDVYDLYLRGRGLLEGRPLAQLAQEAATLFEEVVARDRSFAPAYAGLAFAYAYMSMSPYEGKAFDDARTRVRPAALRALDLDPLLPEAHAAMGWAHARAFEWASAERSFQRGLELAPTLTPITVNYVYSTLRPLGKLEYAERLLRQALKHDPLSRDAQSELAAVLVDARRYQDAVDLIERIGLGRQPGADVRLHKELARALSFTGRYEDALAVLANPRLPTLGQEQWRALPLVKLGRRHEVENLAIAHRAYPFRLAFIYAALGEEDRALQALESMVEREPQRVAIAAMQPELAALRSNPRWAAVRGKLNLP